LDVGHHEVAVAERQLELFGDLVRDTGDALDAEGVVVLVDRGAADGADPVEIHADETDTGAEERLHRPAHVEIVQQIAHDAVGPDIAAGRNAADRIELVAAITELELGAHAVAEAVTDRADAGEAPV